MGSGHFHAFPFDGCESPFSSLVPYLDNIAYTAHAVQRLDERGISQSIVEEALEHGEIIERYDTAEEARYLLHYRFEGRNENLPPMIYHIVAADQAHGRTLVVTAYDPRTQSDRWSDDYKTRID